MKTRKAALFLAVVMLVGVIATAIPTATVNASYIDDFLNTVGPMCTADMRDNHILASFSLAQAIWESGWGRSTLAVEANALFGIRAYGGWDGMIYDRNEKVLYDNWDAIYAAKGEAYVKEQTLSFWRAYPSWQESVNDHSALFNNMDIYANLRGNYDYKSCAKLVVEDGYCGEPSYTQCLIDLIEQFDLESYNYDFGGDAVTTPTALTVSPKTLFMDKGAAYTLSVAVTPADTSYTVTSSNSAVASVSGNTVTALANGSATITVSAGGSTALCHLAVKEGYGGIVADGVYVKCLASDSQVTIPAEAKTIAAGAFTGTGVKTVIVGNSVSSIQSGAFSGVSGLTLCSYGNSVVSSFASANSIQYVNLSASWYLDSSVLIVMNMPVYTTASVVSTYYEISGSATVLTAKNGTALNSTDVIGTGCKLTVGGKTYTIMVKGDTNGDGKNSTADLLLIKSYLAGSDSALPDRAYRRAADYNGDNRITTADYLSIFKES